MAVTTFEDMVRRTTLNGDGCMVWTGSKKGAYSGVYDGKSQRYGHRMAYEEVIGPIPASYVIDHKCRNKLCVNPFHLEAVTQSVNTRRGLKGGSVHEDGTFKCKKCGSHDFYSVRSPRSYGGKAKQCAPCGRRAAAAYAARNRESVNAGKRAACAAKKAAK